MRPNVSIHIALVVMAVVGGLLLFGGAGSMPSVRAEADPPYVPGELIISFQPGVTAEEIGDFYDDYDLLEEETLDSDLDDDDPEVRLVTVPVELTEALIGTLEQDPRMEYAELNYIVSADVTPNDPQFGQLWGLNNTGQSGGTPDADIDAAEAWAITTGSSAVIVGVIDTGVNYNHEDLSDNIWKNPGECLGPGGTCVADGVDNDGNGYVDDFYGINAITNSGDPMDDHGHGTHVAGTIGARGNNGIGVAGVNWTVRIAACKFLNSSGSGTIANAIKCFKYFNSLKNVQGQNVLVTNNSWGGGGFSQATKDAMAGLDQPGMAPILHATAAGNSNNNNDASLRYPSSYDLDNIIAVAATDRNDLYASFSSYGATTVDIAAPGVSILSTYKPSNGYGSMSGTSMATPHVVGAAGLVWAQYPSLSAAEVKQRILSGADYIGDKGSNSSKPTLTNGRLNVFNALENDTTPPAAVTNLAASGYGLASATLTWTATGDDGLVGTASSYDIRYSTSLITDANWATATQAVGEPSPQPSGSTETFTVTGLDPSTTYYSALKVRDNGNESGLSNVITGSTAAGTIFFQDDMEGGTGAWTSTGLWHQSTQRSDSPSTAWYYGIEGVWNYNTGGANSGTLTSSAISLAGATEAIMTFAEWSQLESLANYDRTRVQVSTNGTTWATVFESHGTNNAWAKRTVDLTPYIGGNIYLRLWFDTIDGIYNNYEGWYVDDVNVLVSGTDSDSDGVLDGADNCPNVSNPDQADTDGDGMGDVCDADDDNDGQSDADETACGSDPLDDASLSPDNDADGVPDCVDADDDNDGDLDGADNCPLTANPGQEDTDGDGMGDVCDADDDNDGQTDADETACGSDPLDDASLSPDNDSDGVPDCVDPDADGNLIKGSAPGVYVMDNGQKRHAVSAEVFLACGYFWDAIFTVSDSFLNSIPTGPPLDGSYCPSPTFTDGTLLKGSASDVWVMDNGQKRHAVSAEVFLSCGYQWGNVNRIGDSTLAVIPDGPPLSACVASGTLLRGSAPDVFITHKGLKRHLVSLENFIARGFSGSDVLRVSDSLLNSVSTGQPLLDALADGNLLKGSASDVYVMEAGQKRHAVSREVFLACGYFWDAIFKVPDSVMNSIPTGPPLDGSSCPKPTFTNGTLLKGSASDVWVMEDGQKRHAVSAEMFLSCGYQWGNLNTIPDSMLDKISDGPTLSGPPCP